MSHALRTLPRFLLLCLTALALCTATGCGKKAQAEGPKEERHPLTGVVMAVDTQTNILKVRHDEIPGYMPAMTMEFSVSAGDAALAAKGQKIRAELVTAGDGEFRLEKLWIEDPAKVTAVDAAAKTLTQDTVTRGKNAYREVGQDAPTFALYNQDGEVVESARFRGKQIVLNFIFTRCPVPTMCPAAVARFQQLQREAAEAGVKNLELVSISLDPTYDTPGVLKTYAITRGIDTGNFSLLTGPETAIKSLLSSFGVLVNFEGDLLNHTLTTVLIDENGRIVHREDGSRWETGTFLGKLKKG